VREAASLAGAAGADFSPGEVVDAGYGPTAIDDFYDELDAEATV
jgi:hypothetical protein